MLSTELKTFTDSSLAQKNMPWRAWFTTNYNLISKKLLGSRSVGFKLQPTFSIWKKKRENEKKLDHFGMSIIHFLIKISCLNSKLNFTFCPSASVLFKSKMIIFMINSFRYVHHPVLSLVVFFEWENLVCPACQDLFLN